MRRTRVLMVLAVLGAAVAVPAFGATPKPVASLLGDEGEQQVQDALERSQARARARARRAPADPRRFKDQTDADAVRTATEARRTQLQLPRIGLQRQVRAGGLEAVLGAISVLISSTVPIPRTPLDMGLSNQPGL